MAPRSFFGAGKKRAQSSRARAQRPSVPVNGVTQPAQRLLSIAENLLTTEDVRVRLSLGSIDAVYRMVRDYGLPRRRVGGVWRFVPSEVNAWLEAQNAPALAALQIVGRN